MLIAQSTHRREEKNYSNNNYLEKRIRKALILLGWTLIRIKLITEILKEVKKTRMKKELESSLAQLKSKFRQTKKLLKEDWKGFNK